MQWKKQLKRDTSFLDSGHRRGIDITAERNNSRLLIQVKSAKANHNFITKKRSYFDSGQIKSHFGNAIVKSLEVKSCYLVCNVAIVNPNGKVLKIQINKSVKHLKKLDIIHF